MGFHHLKFAAIITIGFLYSTLVVTSLPNTYVTTVLCNSGQYTAGDPFATSLAYVFEELLIEAPKHKNYELYDISPYPNGFAYGHGTCNKHLTSSDCLACLGAAKTAMLGSCQNRIGARVVLHDCAIRISTLENALYKWLLGNKDFIPLIGSLTVSVQE
ncbi:antifungal protein ginkbilobin-like protein [Humulus lupulus]|uniref:antifungal protein ginkbilobin-like protein n=1 Tax=Humulus lupulus TaxID=3486 RepID=UPI002B4068E1|nr:antifungal protein ginkbilobin-like protein [Humulus lupulus]